MHDDAESVVFVADEVPPADAAGKLDDLQRLLVRSFAVTVLNRLNGVAGLDVVGEDEDAGVFAVEADGVEVDVIVFEFSSLAQMKLRVVRQVDLRILRTPSTL